jgi:hypothetical protein
MEGGRENEAQGVSRSRGEQRSLKNALLYAQAHVPKRAGEHADARGLTHARARQVEARADA